MSKLEMFGQSVDLNGYAATVMDVQQWTETHVSSHGGGGYVHPQYGGWIEAPTITSRSSRHQRVRFKFEDGGPQTGIDLPAYIHLSPGDKVALIAAENPATKRWCWTGIGNATTGECNILDASAPIIAVRMPSLLAKYGWFMQQRLAMGQGGALVVLVCVVIAAFAGRFISSWAMWLLLFGGRADGDLVMLLGWSLAIGIHVAAWRRSKGVINAENAVCAEKIHACFKNMPLRGAALRRTPTIEGKQQENIR